MKRLVLISAVALAAAPAHADGIVAALNLPAGTVLSAADITPDPGQPDGLSPAQAVGLETRLAVYQGRPITAATLVRPTLVGRNQIVTLAYASAALRIETEGRALGAGGAGDVIRVMNLSSRTTLNARINPDGTLTVAPR